MQKDKHKIKRKYGKILGVNIASSSNKELLNQIQEKLTSEAKDDKFFIVTPNPEIVLKGEENSELKRILNKADFSIPDGIGLKIYGDRRLDIYPGRKLMLDICRFCDQQGLKVFVLGGSRKSNEAAMRRLRLMHSNLKVEGATGARYDETANPVSEIELKSHFDTVKKINSFAPDIIFVALGCPKQEFWIDKYLPILKARSAMTVGGAIDYLSGQASLPPQIFENLGLEWLWRLYSEPARIGRIINAFFVFPWHIFLSKINPAKNE